MKELDDFASWMRTLNRSEHTIRGYRSDLAALFAFVGHQRPARVSSVDLEDFLTARVDTTAASTRARHTHAFRAFFAWWARRSRRPSPAEGLETPRLEERLPRALSEREYRTVRDVVRGDLRLAAMVEIVLQTGLRIGELVRLEDAGVRKGSKSSPDSGSPGLPNARGHLKGVYSSGQRLHGRVAYADS